MSNFWQKVKDFFKKFWHFVAIGFLAVAVVVLIIVMCVCMVPKGSGNEGDNSGKGGEGETPQIVTFDAPANVTVEGKTLTWDATEGATNGYTVKINDYEMLTGETSLSLASATVTAHLTYGDNALAVRVNAVYNKDKSAYSEDVTYTYNLPESVRTFLSLVTELGDDVTAEGVEAKIAAVEEAYAAMTEEEQDLEEVKEPKTQFETFKVKYAAYGQAQEFAAQVEAIDITATTADDDISEAESAYNALSSTAKEFAQEANEALATKKTEREAYLQGVEDATEEFTALKATIAQFKLNAELSDDGKSEAIIAAIAQKTKYAENVLANTAVAELLEEIETEEGAAETQIKGSLETLKANITTALGATDPNETNYDALTDKEDKLENLGAYAQSQFATVFEKSFDTVQEELAVAKTTMWNKPLETNVSESMATLGDTRKLYLTVQFKNFKGELIKMANPPEVTIEQEKTGAGNATVDQQLTRSETGEYVAIIRLYSVANITSASYSIGELVQNEAIDVTPPLGYNPFFTDDNGSDGFKVAFNETGIIFTIQDRFTTENPAGKTYLEIYETGTITKDSEGFLQFKGSPIAGKDGMTRIDVSDWGTNDKKIENFNRYLALNYGDYFIGESRSVHFVIYGEVEGGGRTAIDVSTVSSAQTFELTELDKYYTIPNTGKSDAVNQDGDDYRFYLTTVAVAGGMIDDVNAILTENGKTFRFTDANSLKTQFGIRITIKSGNEVVGRVNLPMEENANKFSDITFRWARAYFAESPTEESVTFTNLTYTANYYAFETDEAGDDVTSLFKQGATWSLNAPEALQTVTLTTADRLIALKTTGKTGKVTNDNIELTTIADMGMMINGSGEANGYSINQMLTENGSEYQIANADALKNDFGIRLTINGTIGGEAWEKVLYLELKASYKIGDIVKLCAFEYYKANPNADNTVTVSDLAMKACYYVHKDANADVKDLFKESAEWDITGLPTSMDMKLSDITLNAPAAIRLSDNGWVVIVRDTTPNGGLLTSGAAKYVKYEFYKKDAPNTKYTMYLFVNEENHVEFYKEINEDGTPKGDSFTLLQNTVATDAGVPIGNFITNLKNAFEGIDFTGNWIFVDQYIVEGSDQYLSSTPNTTEFLVTGNSMSVVTED